MRNLAACGEENGSEKEKEGSAAEKQEINIYFDEKSEEYYAEDTTLLLTVKEKIPVVEISGNKEASDEINKYIRSFHLQGMSVEDARKWAEEDYITRGRDNWYGYEMQTIYLKERADDMVISFLVSSYSYMGGAHGNTVEGALNFDSYTGRRLTLTDVTKDEKAAVREIMKEILEQTKTEKYKDMLFEDYERSIGDLLTEDTWYLAEDGFHIIGNEYIISPHAAGILDFMIPYDKADFLKDQYLLGVS